MSSARSVKEPGLSLSSSVRDIRGIGPAASKGLERAGVFTVADLLDLLPRAYIDYSNPIALSAAAGGESFFHVTVISQPERYRGRTGVPVLSFLVEDDEGERAQVTLFNQSYLLPRVRTGTPLYLYGRADRAGELWYFKAPKIHMQKPNPPISPVYQTIEGLPQSRLRKAFYEILSTVQIDEPHTQAFLDRFSLMSLEEAYRAIHLPQDTTERERGFHRLYTDQCFTLARILDDVAVRREIMNESPVAAQTMIADFCRRLPFEPTRAQQRAMRDIAADLDSPLCMNRLLQGDVGSGKTAVALFAAYAVMRAGSQALLMAPTEVLARQHFDAACQILPKDRVFLLTGQTPIRERHAVQEKLLRHTGTLLIGTHALLYGDLTLRAPALLITDEQHRFGVRQRQKLLSQDSPMHSLTVSATPIPRSLALAMHGQTNVSVLDEAPPGRTSTATSYVPPGKIEDMFRFIATRAKDGKQSFIVCPAIEPDKASTVHSASETYRMLQDSFPNVRFGLLHGRCTPAEKESTMRSFAQGDIDVLVATTVIEVGVDVPNASVMAILDADRFGLAQLHQLRGRVGRGPGESYCFLTSASRNALERIRVLCQTNDGFRIAEEDLKERGAGDFLGERQHGQKSALSLLIQDNADLLAEMRSALADMSSDPLLIRDYAWFTQRAQEEMDQRLQELAMN